MKPIVIVALVGVAAVAAAVRPSPVASVESQDTATRPGTDTARVRSLLDGVRGTPPLACELALQWANAGWYSNQPTPDADSAVTAMSRMAGRRVEDPLAVAPLIVALDDTDPCVRRLAVRLLGRSGLEGALEALTAALRSPEPGRRVQGAVGLGLAGQEQYIPNLLTALRDPDPRVREAAAWGLGVMQ
jgi:HEAT repeat protein